MENKGLVLSIGNLKDMIRAIKSTREKTTSATCGIFKIENNSFLGEFRGVGDEEYKSVYQLNNGGK